MQWRFPALKLFFLVWRPACIYPMAQAAGLLRAPLRYGFLPQNNGRQKSQALRIPGASPLNSSMMSAPVFKVRFHSHRH
jgi:hypothetical protein